MFTRDIHIKSMRACVRTMCDFQSLSSLLLFSSNYCRVTGGEKIQCNPFDPSHGFETIVPSHRSPPVPLIICCLSLFFSLRHVVISGPACHLCSGDCFPSFKVNRSYYRIRLKTRPFQRKFHSITVRRTVAFSRSSRLY